MKQNNFLKTVLLAVALLAGSSMAWADAGDPTDMPTSNGTSVVLDKSKATTSGSINNTTETTGEYGSIQNGATLTFKLNNTTAQQYTISFLAGTANSNNSVKVQILSSADASDADYEGTINIYNSSHWDKWCQYAFTTSGNVGTGDKYLKLTFLGAGYICNAKSITITAGEKPAAANLVGVPAAGNTAYAFTLAETVTYTSQGSGTTPNQKTSGTTPYYDNYGSNGLVTYALYNSTSQYYNISFNGATTNGTSSFTIVILDAVGSVEATKEFTINNNGNWTQFDAGTLYSFTTSTALSTGYKTLLLKFTNVNVANLTFTPAVATTQYTVTTSASPAVGGTVNGAGDYDEGTNVTITQSAKWGYQFSSWTVNDAAAGSEASYTITSIAANTTVVGNFSINDGIFQSIPTAAESYLDLTLANPDLATNGQPTASYLDNYRGGEQTQFALRSTTAQRYYVSFKAARNNEGSASLTFSFATKSDPSTTVFSKDMTITNNGSWTDFSNTYSFATDALAAGDWIMTITFNGSGTTCNMKDFALVLFQALDESSNYTAVASSNTTVTLTRSINANKWSTIVLPFDIASGDITTIFGDGASIAELKSGNASTLTFSTTLTDSKMKANQPYAIKVASDFTTATINGVTIVSGTPTQAITNWQFVGTYGNGTIAADNNYYFKSNNLYKAGGSGTTSIKPFRAYLHYTGSEPAPAPTFTIDGDVTGIAHISADGQMSLEEGVFYNLAGQRVAQPTKGLYIVNGKKVILK